jgi:hypothetical protein
METTRNTTTSIDAISTIIEAGATATCPKEFFRTCLGAMARSMNSPFAVLEVQLGASLIKIDHDGGSADPNFWREPLTDLVEECISLGHTATNTSSLYTGQQTQVGIALFATPLTSCGGAIALILPCETEAAAQRLGDRLESLATVLSITAAGLSQAKGQESNRAVTPNPRADLRAELAAQTLRRASDFETSAQLAITITNRLAGKEGFDQVSLGRVHGKSVKLLAVSGLDHIEKKSEGIEHIEQAMSECLDFKEPIACQAEEWAEPSHSEAEQQPPSARLHQKWHEAARLVPVVSIPLLHGDSIAAIISIRRNPGAALSSDEIESITKMIAPFGGALAVVDRANRSLASHLTSSLLRAPAAFLSRNRIGQNMVMCAILGLAIWSWFGTLPYRVTANTQLRAQMVRVVGVPVEATLKSAEVVPGMNVAKGDVLAVFDTLSLELEVLRLNSELAIVTIEENQAIAAGDPVEVALRRAHSEELAASISLATYQIDLATIRAPFDGILVEGDHRERIGANFTKGEPLFRISESDSFKLELWIDEADIGVVETSQVGSFSAYARPEIDFPFTVTRIAPAAKSHNDTNAFLVEAELEESARAEWTRSGMEGVGSIDIEPRRPLWVWFHGLLDSMRMRSWL